MARTTIKQEKAARELTPNGSGVYHYGQRYKIRREDARGFRVILYYASYRRRPKTMYPTLSCALAFCDRDAKRHAAQEAEYKRNLEATQAANRRHTAAIRTVFGEGSGVGSGEVIDVSGTDVKPLVYDGFEGVKLDLELRNLTTKQARLVINFIKSL